MILWNIINICLQLPGFLVYLILEYTDYSLTLGAYLFYSSYALDFYFLFGVNKVFRKEVLAVFKRKQSEIKWKNEEILL